MDAGLKALRLQVRGLKTCILLFLSMFASCKKRSNPVAVDKVKAHQRCKTMKGFSNEKADIAAKEGVRMRPRWVMPEMVELDPVSKVTPSEPGVVDLVGLLHQDLEWNKLVQSGKHRDWCVW